MVERGDDAASRLDRYWDSVVGGNARPGGTDPGMAETIAAIEAMEAAPRPDAAFVDRLAAALELARPAAPSANGRAAESGGNGTAALRPGHGRRQPAPIPSARPSWGWLSHAAMTAMFVLTVALAFVTGRMSSSGDLGPAADWASTMILRTSIPALPPGDLGVRVERWRLDPDERSSWRAAAADLPLLLYLESDGITASVGRPVTVARAASVKRGAAVLPAGTSIPLRAGELLVVPAGAGDVLTAGESAARSILVVQFAPSDRPASLPRRPPGLGHVLVGQGTLPGLPAGPGIVYLRRLDADREGVAPAEIAAGPDLVMVETGVAGLRVSAGAAESVRTAGDVAGVVAPARSSVSIRNASGGRLSLLRLMVVPVAGEVVSPLD